MREALGLNPYQFWKQHFEARGYTKKQMYRLDESCERIDPARHLIDLWEVSGWSAEKFLHECKPKR